MPYWICPTCHEWHLLPDVPDTTICPRDGHHGVMSGPYDRRDPRLVEELRARPVRRPAIDRIVEFFEKRTVPKAPPDQYQMNFVLFNENRQAYFDEFAQRVRALRPAVAEDAIVGLWYRLLAIFQLKTVDAAKAFIAHATQLGLHPLETQSARLFWSGVESRKVAYENSSAELTALEKTDIGTLLDKLSVFKTVPWELSTVLWALVSRYFGMGATGDMHVYLDGGFAVGNVFWNDELPVLRLMQRYGAVRQIIIHLWHTRDHRWLEEFAIDSDKLLLVFDKSRRIPAPTPDNPQATRSFRYARPLKVAALRRFFERYLQNAERRAPLVFFNFRKATCIFARVVEKGIPLRIEFFEYDNDATKHLKVVAPSVEAAFAVLPSIEKFLMANYHWFTQMPQKLVYADDAIFDRATKKILALRTAVDQHWYYKLSFSRNFNCSPAVAVGLIRDLIAMDASGYLRVRFGHVTTQTIHLGIFQQVLAVLFDNAPGLQMQPLQRVAAINRIRENYQRI